MMLNCFSIPLDFPRMNLIQISLLKLLLFSIPLLMSKRKEYT